MAFPRFVVAGAINTGATYLLYLLLLQVSPYGVAYSLSFVAGILIGYLLNSLWVFKRGLETRTATTYPLAYLLNYLLGIGLLWVLVDVTGLPASVAPLLVMLVSVPLMYVVTKTLFQERKQ